MVNDYTDGGKRKPKNPDPLGPPSILHEGMHGVFQPLPSTMNPLGLCHFYHTDPSSTSMLTPPKPPAMAEHVKSLLLLTKTCSEGHISSLCSKVALLLHVGAVAGTAYVECTGLHSHLPVC